MPRTAIATGDDERAVALIDEGAARTRSLQLYSIEWITSLLSFIGRELGEDAVERALRASGDDFIKTDGEGAVGRRCQRKLRAKVIARAMVANGGDVRGRRGRREDRALVPMR